MPYTASALGRSASGTWRAADLDLSETEDVDGLLELAESELGADDRTDDSVDNTLLVFIDEDDEYLLIVRGLPEDDPALFVSDQRVLAENGLAGRIVGEDLALPEPPDSDEESSRPEVEPAGDIALLADFGVSASELLALCAEEGQLPADVIFAIGEKIGAADVLEAVRGI